MAAEEKPDSHETPPEAQSPPDDEAVAGNGAAPEESPPAEQPPEQTQAAEQAQVDDQTEGPSAETQAVQGETEQTGHDEAGSSEPAPEVDSDTAQEADSEASIEAEPAESASEVQPPEAPSEEIQKAKADVGPEIPAGAQEPFPAEMQRGWVFPAAGAPAIQPTGAARRTSVVKLLLLFNAALIAVLVIVVLLFRPWRPRTAGGIQEPSAGQTSLPSLRSQALPDKPDGQSPTVAPELPVVQTPSKPQPTLVRREDRQGRALSWPESEQALLDQRYTAALNGYGALLKHSQVRPDNELISDFLRLRVAQCLVGLEHDAQADELYAQIVASRSPAVRTVAHYQLAVRDLLNGQFLRARMRAYLAIAALSALDVPLALETDCDFLIARALTQKVLSFGGQMDAIRWRPLQTSDPFVGLSESQLRNLLAKASEGLSGAVLGPQMSQVESQAGGRLFSVTATRCSIEEFLSRLASRAGLELKWVSVAQPARSRSVSVGYRRVSEQRLGEVACGAVGLLGRYDGQAILVYDPQAYAVLSDQRKLLSREAESAWRRLFLRAPEDRRIARGYFAAAVLQEFAGQETAAMKAYQLIAHRFERQDVAPAALLRSAALRIQLRDYTGARLDLLDLLDRYPNYPASETVYLYLGQATMKAGLLDEAIRVFRKLYYLNRSSETQKTACLGAARCFYKTGNMTEANKWATRYIGLVKSPQDGLAEAYVLLARTEAATGNAAEAVVVYHRALDSGPSAKLRVEVLLELADAELEREKFLGAIAALEELRSLTLTQHQTYEFLLKAAKLYRRIGIPEKAAATLRSHLRSVKDPSRKAALAAELAKCYMDEGNLAAAEKILLEFLPKMEPTPAAQDAACCLAEIYLKSAKIDQAIMLAKKLLASSCPPEVRKRAQEVLGAAYVSRHDYEQAVLAYSGLMFEEGSSQASKGGQEK